MPTNYEIQEALGWVDGMDDGPYYTVNAMCKLLAAAYRAAIAERDRFSEAVDAVTSQWKLCEAERDLWKRQYEDAMNHALAYVRKPHFAEFRELQERHAAERAKEV